MYKRQVKWNIVQNDFLKSFISEKFDFIIGNPPYITYSDLNKTTRSFIKKNFTVCSEGKPDYYYAFIERSIKALADDGKLAYLIPNNIFKNRFADRLRVFMLPHLSVIVDYTTEKLFENKLTSSAIIICNGTQHNNDIRYVDKVKKREIKMHKNNLTHKWIFRKKEVAKENKKRKFGDDFNAMCPIATLLNEVFILKKYEECDEYILVNGYKIEKTILREAVSPRSLQYGRKEFLIFPYSYRDNNILRYEELGFIQEFPGAYSYLKFFIEKLNKRDKDENAKWFEFGRSQALSRLNQEKLLLSTLITEEVKIHHISRNQVPYSGICIYQKGDLSLEIAEKILKSDDFLNYVYDIGINASGTTMRITARDVMNFEYTLD
ncbi:Type IIS restriction enzyme Eco57I [Haemophilus influenzae]|nr:Type IIS restriction enzyme Eco57I [Haemophilus influenzae]